ncbi:hypothetical protein RUND412_009972 [Rhizina undulata]
MAMAMATSAISGDLTAIIIVHDKLFRLLKQYFLGAFCAPVIFLQLTRSLESLSQTLQRVLDEAENPASKVFRVENRAAIRLLLGLALRGAGDVLVNLESVLNVLKVPSVREQTDKWWLDFLQRTRENGERRCFQDVEEKMRYHRWSVDLVLKVLRKDNTEVILKSTRRVGQNLERLLDPKIVTSDSRGQAGASIRSKFSQAAERNGDVFIDDFTLESAIRMAMYWSFKAITGLENIAAVKIVSPEAYLNLLKSSWITQLIRADSRWNGHGAMPELRAVLELVSTELFIIFKTFLEAKIDPPELETLTKYADFEILLSDCDASDLITPASPLRPPKPLHLQTTSLPVLAEEYAPLINPRQESPEILQRSASRCQLRPRSVSDASYGFEGRRRRPSTNTQGSFGGSVSTVLSPNDVIDEIYSDSPTLGRESIFFPSETQTKPPKVVVPENSEVRHPSLLPHITTRLSESAGMRWESPHEVTGRPRGSSAGSGGSGSGFALGIGGEVVDGVRPGEEEVNKNAFRNMNILASDSFEPTSRWDESVVHLFRNATGDLRILTTREGAAAAHQFFVPLKDAELVPHYAHSFKNQPVMYIRKMCASDTRSISTRRSSTSSSSSRGELIGQTSLYYQFKGLEDMLNFQAAFLGEAVNVDVRTVKSLSYKRGLLDSDSGNYPSRSRLQLWRDSWRARACEVAAGGRGKGTIRVRNTRMVIYSEIGVFCLFVTDNVVLDTRPKTNTLRIKPSAHKKFNNPSSVRVCSLGRGGGWRLDMKGARMEDVESWEEWKWLEVEFELENEMEQFRKDFDDALQERRKERKRLEELKRLAANGVRKM